MLSCFVNEHYKNDEEAMERINEFNKFSTYFVGYHQTRENLYSNEEKHTAIAYRLIDENLQIFRNNLKLYKKFAETCSDKVLKIKEELVLNADDYFTNIKQYSKCLSQEDIEKYNLIITGKNPEKGQKIQGINEYINLYNQQNKDKPKLVKFKVLYKQILSDTNSSSFVLDVIENDKQAIEMINNIFESFKEVYIKEEFVQAFKNISEFKFDKTFTSSAYF